MMEPEPRESRLQRFKVKWRPFKREHSLAGTIARPTQAHSSATQKATVLKDPAHSTPLQTRATQSTRSSGPTGPTQPSPTQNGVLQSNPAQSSPAQEIYDDHTRVRRRYEEAVRKLKDALQYRKDGWEPLNFEIPDAKAEDFDDATFQDYLNDVLKAREESIADKKGWGKFGHTVQTAFTIFSPFAKNFLNVAINAQALPVLNPYGLVCGGLFLLITIADKEVGRKAEITETLDYLCQQIGLLDVASSIPEEIAKREVLIDRSVDVRIACMLYIATHIRHNATLLGIFGRISKILLTGDENLKEANEKLKSSIDSYNSTLANIHVRVSLKTHELVKGMNDILLQRVGNEVQSEDRKFIVPFERNPYFVGRKEFLSRIKATLSDEVPKKYNHRVAMYGMGGLGKTQTAIEYVYTNRAFYERVYWITAVDRDSLLLGYRKIAEHVGLKALPNSDPIAIAEAVIGWLGEKSSWLVVLDNLDDISVAANCLPPCGPRRHTLITTRNPNSRNIPAEGLEVPLFGEAEALELLHTMSDIPLPSNDPNEAPPEAREIVQEFGYLPLGIVQAAAFTRNYSGDFRAFLDDYQRNRKTVNSWVSEGNVDYPRSLAATSTMSLNKLRIDNPIAVEIFQILSFLTPDGIIIEFLQAGAESPALCDNHKRILFCRVELSKVLIELEKFSLLKWNRVNKTIAIHRLVQTVVKDEMSSSEFNWISAAAVELCLHIFPKDLHDLAPEVPTLRKYAGQFPALLVDPKIPPSMSLLKLLRAEGVYLELEGKANVGESFLLRACSMSEQIYGRDSQLTHSVKSDYAYCLVRGGKLSAAASIQEANLESCKRLFGEDHEDTITNLHILGLIYYGQGKLGTSIEVAEIALEKMKRTAGNEGRFILVLMQTVARLYTDQGRYMEAVELLTFVLEKMPENHIDSFAAMEDLAGLYLSMGKREEGSRLLKGVVEKYTGFWGKDHPKTMSMMINQGIEVWNGGNKVDAIAIVEEVLSKQRGILGGSHSDTLCSIGILANWYKKSGRQAEAVDLIRAELSQVASYPPP